MVAGVVVYDVDPESTAAPATRQPGEVGTTWTAARELTAFAGPDGPLFGADDLLFSVGADGLSVWAVDRGARIGALPGFVPQYQDRRAGLLIELNGDHVRTWRYQPDQELPLR